MVGVGAAAARRRGGSARECAVRVLVACEFSGVVRRAFRARGHDAWSCDLIPAEDGGEHIQDDVLSHLHGWDLVIAHPPCTFLSSSGARWLYDPRYPNRIRDRDAAAAFFMRFVNSASKWAIENPIGYMNTRFRKPDQIIQPWQHGHNAAKATCLWLGGLPKLQPTRITNVTYKTTSSGKKFSTWYWETSKVRGEARRRERARTFEGIAAAMAEQWG